MMVFADQWLPFYIFSIFFGYLFMDKTSYVNCKAQISIVQKNTEMALAMGREAPI